MTAGLVHLRVPPSPAQDIGEGAGTRRREGSSYHGQNRVADEMKAYTLRPWRIEEEPGGRLNHVLAQLPPRIPLREDVQDVLRKAFGAIATVGFLDNLEQQFGHTSMIPIPPDRKSTRLNSS